MIDRKHPLSISKRAKAVSISQGSSYYLPRSVSDFDLNLMRRIDQLHLEYPFAGSRMLRDQLKQEGYAVGRTHVVTLMRKMGVEALYRKPRTTKPGSGHKIYPYLLRGMKIDRPNQVCAMDLTYIPMARGFVYLVAVVDWFTRRVLSWNVSITMDVHFCLEAVEEAISQYGTPEIMNTDQGSQFTSLAFTKLMKNQDIRISMDCKGAWRDNIFVERLWRTIKYEDIYLRAYGTISEVGKGLNRYISFYNSRRPHSSRKEQTPDQVYFDGLEQTQVA